MIMIIEYIFNISNLSIIVCFFRTKPLMLGILFSKVVNAVFVAKSAIQGILFSNVVNAVFVAKPLLPGMLFLIQ